MKQIDFIHSKSLKLSSSKRNENISIWSAFVRNIWKLFELFSSHLIILLFWVFYKLFKGIEYAISNSLKCIA